MGKNCELNPQQLIDETFHDLALCLGGIFLVHQVDDKVVWAVMKSLDDLYVSTKSRVPQSERGQGEKAGKRPVMVPHPAVEGFLQKVGMRSV